MLAAVVFPDYQSGVKTLQTEFCKPGDLYPFSDGHLCPLWTMGGEVAVVVHVELILVCACAIQSLADSAVCVGFGSRISFEAFWSSCIVGRVEYVVRGGVLSACALA